MERKARGVKKDGAEYDCLFDAASGIDETIKQGANLDDTIAMLPVKVREKKYQADRISAALKDIDDRVTKTCYNIWKWLTDHIAYKPDQKGKEQVRSVRRLWSDRLGDCDCFSFFTSCVLSNLRIPHFFRIASYDKVNGTFGHVYVVVPDNGKEIIIDAVKDKFNDEHPYEKIKDIDMDLEFLDGIDPEDFTRSGGMSIDAEDLLSCQLPKQGEDLGRFRLFNRDKEPDKPKPRFGEKIKEAGKKVKQVAGKTFHVINRVNPATTALRLGVLSAMKLNMFKVAENLRYAYLSDAEAQKRGLNMKRFERYKRTREKLEKIFFNAGGKPENLKEAILTGKGNQDKAVALSGYSLSGLGNTGANTIQEIIGDQIYADEFSNEPGLSGLGVIATAAAVTAASGVLATIAGIIKNIGPLFEKGEPGEDPGFEQLEKEAGTAERAVEEEMPTNESGESPPPDAPPDSSGDNLWDKTKAWAAKNKTPLIIAGVAALALGGVWAYNKFGKNKSGGGRRAETTDGIPHGAKGRTRQHDGRTKKGRNEKILRDLRLSRMK